MSRPYTKSMIAKDRYHQPKPDMGLSLDGRRQTKAAQGLQSRKRPKPERHAGQSRNRNTTVDHDQSERDTIIKLVIGELPCQYSPDFIAKHSALRVARYFYIARGVFYWKVYIENRSGRLVEVRLKQHPRLRFCNCESGKHPVIASAELSAEKAVSTCNISHGSRLIRAFRNGVAPRSMLPGRRAPPKSL